MKNLRHLEAKRSALLITSAIHVNAKFTKIVDPDERIRRVKDSVEKLLLKYPNLPVVICDGSGFDFSPFFENFPQIKCIFFSTSAHDVSIRGKGYGEGEIINYALETYFQYNPFDVIIKITGGIYVQNLEWIIQANLDFQCTFKSYFDVNKKRIVLHRVDTRLFVFRPSFFNAHLSKVHLNVNELAGKYIEDLYFQAIKSTHINLSEFLLIMPPKFVGYSGSTGKAYGSVLGNLFTFPLKKIKFIIVKIALRYKLWFVFY